MTPDVLPVTTSPRPTKRAKTASPQNDRSWNSSHGIHFQPPSLPGLNSSPTARRSPAGGFEYRDPPSLVPTDSNESTLSSMIGAQSSDGSFIQKEESSIQEEESFEVVNDGSTLSSMISAQTSDGSFIQKEESVEEVNDECPEESSVLEDLQNSEDLMDDANKYTKRPGAGEPPFGGPLGYHIPSDRFEKVLKSPPNTPASYWQWHLYQSPGTDARRVTIHHCRNKDDMEKAAQLFLQEKVIGMDLEWYKYAKRTDPIKKNISLIQVASEEHIALFHIARFDKAEEADDFVSPSLKKLLESPDIMKVGCVIKGDAYRLRKYLNIECRALIELSNLHKIVLFCSGEIDKVDRRWVKLSEQFQHHIGLPLYKGPVQTSDWTYELSEKQKEYAASDPYANIQLFYALEAKRLAFDPTPPRPAFAEAKQKPVRRTKAKSEDSQGLSSSSGLPSLAITSSGEDGAREKPPSPYAKELELADKFVETYKTSQGPTIRRQPLRAYSLWKDQGMDIATMANILGSSPIQRNTVIGYLFDALASLPDSYPCPAEKIIDLKNSNNYRLRAREHIDCFNKALRDNRGS